jgi:hypothetical protein
MDFEENVLHDIFSLGGVAESFHRETVEPDGVEIMEALKAALLACEN